MPSPLIILFTQQIESNFRTPLSDTLSYAPLLLQAQVSLLSGSTQATDGIWASSGKGDFHRFVKALAVIFGSSHILKTCLERGSNSPALCTAWGVANLFSFCQRMSERRPRGFAVSSLFPFAYLTALLKAPSYLTKLSASLSKV